MLLSGLATVSPGRLTCAPGSGAGVSFGVLVAHYSTPGDNGQSCRQAVFSRRRREDRLRNVEMCGRIDWTTTLRAWVW
uniref:Secreted protein n=1 Tax=Knipowitschia caucasica TaxID=637954 RepID=A0AAV2LMJ6_KNICA